MTCSAITNRAYSPEMKRRSGKTGSERWQSDNDEAVMTALDRLGFHVRLKTTDAMRGARIAFLHEVRKAAETRKVLVEMVQLARSQTK